MAGTRGQGRAAEYICQQFQKLGLQVSVQQFGASRLPILLAGRLLPLVAAVLVPIAYYLLAIAPIVSTAIYLVLLSSVLLLFYWQGLIRRLVNLGYQVRSSNVFARRKNHDQDRSDNHCDVVLMAHYDSKSQLVPIVVRIIALFGAIVVVFVLAVMAIWASFDQAMTLPAAMGWLSWLIVALLGILVVNFSSNSSVGALDNAAGVAIVLELARVLSADRASDSLAVSFLATGAEELGMVGAARFIDRHQGDFDPKRTIFLNFDTVGSGGSAILAGGGPAGDKGLAIDNCLSGKDIKTMVAEKLNQQGLKVIRLDHLPAVGLDHMPLNQWGYTGLSICQGVLSAALRIHTRWDVPGAVKKDQLGKIGTAIEKFVEQLADLQSA